MQIKKIKKAITCMAVALSAITLTACNKQPVDTTWKYGRAILSLPDGTVIEGAIESWTDYADGDQIQVKIDGTTYLAHSSQVVLISE